MCKGLIGKKVGMVGVFGSDGCYVPVTVVKVGPCVVTQIKNVSTDGYKALQLSFGRKKSKRVNMPVRGHFKKSGSDCFYFTKEFSVDDPDNYGLGQILGVDVFEVGERVDVVGTTKGRGFSGVIKRHGFSGGKKTHGSKSHRIPGSIGCSAWPSRVVRGKKMPGHYGFVKKTVRNLKIVDIRNIENLIFLKGAVPGCVSGNVFVKKVKYVS